MSILAGYLGAEGHERIALEVEAVLELVLDLDDGIIVLHHEVGILVATHVQTGKGRDCSHGRDQGDDEDQEDVAHSAVLMTSGDLVLVFDGSDAFQRPV
jgi:hypothetical protein